MKALVVSAAALACVASPALAQEEPVWNGVYVGVQGGYGHSTSDSEVTLSGAWASESQSLRDRVVADLSNDQGADSALYGVHIGYNYQGNSPLVLGVEADFTKVDGGDTLTTASAGTPNYSFINITDPDYTISLRARAGYGAGKTLIYATGGWAWSRVDLGAEITSDGGYSKAALVKADLDGFVVGGGVEQRIGSNLSARIEYLYSDQGDVTYTTAYRPGSAFTSPAYTETLNQDFRSHQVRVGLSYAF
ncbi:outer membrane protein [Sphingomonas canadensis]|uniref:Outer membrane protein n=1 Tax=Sphingomonas canadensis TaxID=1219257 RepID=A0ABW3HDI8_9SPHN|nr:outer membrane beta-barrel protein [Sphingomonas canadensis]MCW3837930.1 outer membrane beta-barrel protein [Sphingomonas canadensis]